MTHVSPEDLLLFHFGESDNAEGIRAHLSTCTHCRAELDSLQRTLDTVSVVEVPEIGEDYEESVWEQVRQRLDRAPIRPIQVTPVRRWGWAVGIAASLLFAFMLGRYWPTVPVSERASSPTDDAVERVLAGELAAHLERTSILLTDVVNASGNGTVDLGFRRDRANELASDSRLLRQTADRRGMRSVTLLLDELERILIKVANSSPELPGDQYENLRESIEGQDLLFKVRVTSDRIKRGTGDGWENRPQTTI